MKIANVEELDLNTGSLQMRVIMSSFFQGRKQCNRFQKIKCLCDLWL